MVVRVSRVNGVIFVETGKCAFEGVQNLLILQVMEPSVCSLWRQILIDKWSTGVTFHFLDV